MSGPRLSRLLWQGSGVALVSAIAFALNLVLAGISYEHGANIHALNLSRAISFLICLFLTVEFKKISYSLPRRTRYIALAMGLLLCAEMYALLGAIQTIPVSLAVLIFYTYPIIIAGYRWIIGSEVFSWSALVLLVGAFCGLIIVLIDSPITLNPGGLILAFISAIALAILLIVSERSLNHYNNFMILLHTLAVVSLLVLILSWAIFDLQWPENNLGWFALLGSSVFYVVATLCLFVAVNLIGPLKTAILDNTAPIWAIAFGFLLLGQTLTAQQLIGATIVIVAVVSLQLINKSL